MAVVTYYSLFSTGVTVFNGFVTNTGSQCSSPSAPVYPALGELSTVNSLCAGSSPRYQATGTMTNQMSFAVGGFAEATVVSGASWQIYIRKPSTKQFWLEAYNAAGVKQASLGPVSATGSSTMANVAFPGSLTVPASGFLVVRCGFTGVSNRFYFGQNPKSNGLPSAVLTTTQLPAITGPVGNGAGTLVLTGSGSGVIAQPVTRTASVTLYDHTGTLLLNQVCKVYSDGGAGVSDTYLGEATSDPVTGVISFTQTLPAAQFTDVYFTGSYSQGGKVYTYRSEPITPV